MVFWIAVVIGAVFAWAAVQIGFYGAWIMLFNLVLSAYMAIFVTPVVIESIPAATAIPDYGCALTTLSIAVATLFISYGACYAFLSGKLRAPFPNVFDNVGAGLLGFFSGFLVCSFAAFTFSLTPLSEFEISKSVGLDEPSQKTNVAYMCWWCNRLNSFISTGAGPRTQCSDAVALLLEKARPKPVAVPQKSNALAAAFGDAATAPTDESDKTAEAAPATTEAESPEAPEAKSAAKAMETPPSKHEWWDAGNGASQATTSAPQTKQPVDASASQTVSRPGNSSPLPSGNGQGARAATAANPPPGVDKGAAANMTPPANSEKPATPPGPQGPLSGFWQATSGAVFQITDDGKTAIVKVVPNEALQFLAGKLVRSEDKSDSKSLTGTFDVVFYIDAPKRYTIQVTAEIGDAGQLTLKCPGWPKRWYRGRVAERWTLTETLTRVEPSQHSPFAPNGAAVPPPGF